MSSFVKIAPSIICFDVFHLRQQIEVLDKNNVNTIHIDVMDGNFVSQITYGSDFVKQIRYNFPNLFLDVHLMVNNPYEKIKNFAEVGANCISIHYETLKNIDETLSISNIIKNYGLYSGIVIDAGTDVSVLDDIYSNTFFDKVLIMSVKAGFSGQKFIENTFEKIHIVNDILFKKNIRDKVEVWIDGGVNLEIFKKLLSINVNGVVIGSALHKTENINLNKQEVLNRNLKSFFSLMK